MWIWLGCALAARQWERVWQRAGNAGTTPGHRVAWQRTVESSRLGRAEIGASAPLANEDSVQKRARFWAELREGRREAEERCSKRDQD